METSIDWVLAEAAITELANYVVSYGLDDKDESVFNCYLERCIVHGVAPAEVVLTALGRKHDIASTESNEIDYDYKVTEIKTQGFFVANIQVEHNQEATETMLFDEIRSSVGDWSYSDLNIIKTELIEQPEVSTPKNISFLDRAFNNKPDLITKRVSFYLTATLPGDIIDENETDLISMIHGRLAEYPAFNQKHLITEELQISDEDIVLIPI